MQRKDEDPDVFALYRRTSILRLSQFAIRLSHETGTSVEVG